MDLPHLHQNSYPHHPRHPRHFFDSRQNFIDPLKPPDPRDPRNHVPTRPTWPNSPRTDMAVLVRVWIYKIKLSIFYGSFGSSILNYFNNFRIKEEMFFWQENCYCSFGSILKKMFNEINFSSMFKSIFLWIFIYFFYDKNLLMVGMGYNTYVKIKDWKEVWKRLFVRENNKY